MTPLSSQLTGTSVSVLQWEQFFQQEHGYKVQPDAVLYLGQA
jgi:hypothetical protein